MIWADPKTLDEHPDNWNIHPDRQIGALSASMEANTFHDPICYNLETGKILSGHGRKKAAIKSNIESVPVVVGRWTKEQELRILRDSNILAQLAKTDSEALNLLNERIRRSSRSLEDMKESAKLGLKKIQVDTDNYIEAIQSGEISPTAFPTHNKRVRPSKEERQKIELECQEVGQEEALIVEINEGAIFESSNPYGIPDLLPDQLYDGAPPRHIWSGRHDDPTSDKFYCFSSRPFPEERKGGILGFFTEDYRFKRCYDKSAAFVDEMVDQEWTALIEPDFSTYGNWPYAMRLWAIYRARWCCRLWQEMDIPVIPNLLRFSSFHVHEEEIIYESLPKNPPMVALNCRMLHAAKSRATFLNTVQGSLEIAIPIVKPQTILLYGGQQFKKDLESGLPSGPEYVYLSSYMSERRKRMDS